MIPDLTRVVWRKSSYSGGNGGQCVEVGRGAGIRDSKAPAKYLPVSAVAWTAFLATAKAD